MPQPAHIGDRSCPKTQVVTAAPLVSACWRQVARSSVTSTSGCCAIAIFAVSSRGVAGCSIRDRFREFGFGDSRRGEQTRTSPDGSSDERCPLSGCQVGGSCPSCCSAEYKFATPQWSVIFPLRTRMASTVSKWIVLPVGAMPRKSPRWVPW